MHLIAVRLEDRPLFEQLLAAFPYCKQLRTPIVMGEACLFMFKDKGGVALLTFIEKLDEEGLPFNVTVFNDTIYWPTKCHTVRYTSDGEKSVIKSGPMMDPNVTEVMRTLIVQNTDVSDADLIDRIIMCCVLRDGWDNQTRNRKYYLMRKLTGAL